MSILAIDTATQVSSVAVIDGDKLAAELTMQAKLTHSETLMPHIEQVLKMASQTKADLSGIAVSIGPGSFTGLRIGLAVAKTMAYVLNVPLVGVSTLAAMAAHLPVSGVTLVGMIDAQKGNAYVESYQWQNGELQTIKEVAVCKLTEAIAALATVTGPVIIMGDAVQKKVIGKMELPANVTVAPAHILMPRAACVGILGKKMLQAGQVANVMNLEPVYIRRSEAEVLWEKRHPQEASNTKPTEEM